MESFDAPTLARIGPACTVSAHIIFPAFFVGLASFLAVLNGLYRTTGRAVLLGLIQLLEEDLRRRLRHGVVSGIVGSQHFGTNWSVFSDKAGPVIGPLTQSPA